MAIVINFTVTIGYHVPSASPAAATLGEPQIHRFGLQRKYHSIRVKIGSDGFQFVLFQFVLFRPSHLPGIRTRLLDFQFGLE